MYAVRPSIAHPGWLAYVRLTQSLRERARLVSTINAGYGTLPGGRRRHRHRQLEAKDLEAAEAANPRGGPPDPGGGSLDSRGRTAVTAAEAERVFGRETARD